MQFFEGDENFSWRVLAVESLVIMLSVLLGFTLNSWRVNQNEQETVEDALRSIAAEVRHNMREVEQLLPHYRSMVDTLEYLASVRGEETTIEVGEIPGFRGFRIPILRKSAFQTARSTGALSHMEFELANVIFSTYRYQNYYANLIDKLLTRLIAGDFTTIRDWQMVFTLLANNGGFADEKYPKLLKLISEKYGITAVELDSTASTHTNPTRPTR